MSVSVSVCVSAWVRASLISELRDRNQSVKCNNCTRFVLQKNICTTAVKITRERSFSNVSQYDVGLLRSEKSVKKQNRINNL